MIDELARSADDAVAQVGDAVSFDHVRAAPEFSRDAREAGLAVAEQEGDKVDLDLVEQAELESLLRDCRTRDGDDAIARHRLP